MTATPFLAVDAQVLQHNIDTMAGRAAQLGVALRPHVKTHKCLEIARLQRDAGARGITVATLGEAEVFQAGGFDDITIAYPLWLDDQAATRLHTLQQHGTVRIGIESAESVAAMAQGCPGTHVLVEVDSGHHRTGVQPDRAGELASLAAAQGLRVDGVFTFPGHSYTRETREPAARQEAEALAGAAASLREHGIDPVVVSGGSSPSLAATSTGPLTELRPGAYVFNDAQQWELGACGPAEVALSVVARVVSHSHGRIVLDAGSKALAADRAPWASGCGRLLDHPEARGTLLSEHHAAFEMDGPLPAIGSVVRVVPNHCCNAVALADELVVGRWDGEHLHEDEHWAVAARGRNS